MSTYRNLTTTLTDQYVDALQQVQDLQVSTLRAVSERLAGLVPQFQIPFADRLPDAREIVEANYAIADRVVGAQKAYVSALAGALTPVAKRAEPTAAETKTAKDKGGK